MDGGMQHFYVLSLFNNRSKKYIDWNNLFPECCVDIEGRNTV